MICLSSSFEPSGRIWESVSLSGKKPLLCLFVCLVRYERENEGDRAGKKKKNKESKRGKTIGVKARGE